MIAKALLLVRAKVCKWVALAVQQKVLMLDLSMIVPATKKVRTLVGTSAYDCKEHYNCVANSHGYANSSRANT